RMFVSRLGKRSHVTLENGRQQEKVVPPSPIYFPCSREHQCKNNAKVVKLIGVDTNCVCICQTGWTGQFCNISTQTTSKFENDKTWANIEFISTWIEKLFDGSVKTRRSSSSTNDILKNI
ncbi:unnamed protein product, partial [Owenia fusiformis]